MKLKKFMALVLTATLTLSIAGCGKDDEAGTQNNTSNTNANASTSNKETADALTYGEIVLGETEKDLTATIKVLSHRTDLVDTKFPEYIAEFKEMYPGITVQYETITDYAPQALLRIEQDDWDIMMIPAVDKKDLPTYFIPFGTLEEVSEEVRFANTWMNGENVYGIPSTGNAQGIVYNKKVFADAGITELPDTPDEFVTALQAIEEKTDAIPLYTNYAAGWTMGAWDAYLGGSATGDATFMNQKLLHAQNPFADKGDGTGPYAVYKILYDAVANGLTEEDYTTTDWEGCKGMINNGEIGCMVLGSWAFTQMVDAGPNGADIGYMSFPITQADGKQYASAGADYSYGINAKADEANQKAAMIYVKWLTEESGFSFGEGGIPIDVEGEYPELYAAFDGIEFVADETALAGEEDYLNELNAESELMINAGGDKKIQAIIEHAANKDMSFDDIMAEWNTAWSDAQSSLGIEVK